MVLNGIRIASLGAAVVGALALAGSSAAGSGHAAAATPIANKITVVTPGKAIHARRAFTAEAYARFDSRTHRPPRDYLKASLYYTRGTRDCLPTIPSDKSKIWTEAAHTDFDPKSSARVQFGSRVTLPRTGSYRFCAYIFVERSGSAILSPSTFHVKAHASKVLRAT